MSEVISSFKILRAGSQVFAILMLFLCVILHTMSSGKSLQYDVCENSVSSVYIGGYGGLSESGLRVFRELCPISFLVVGECCSVVFGTLVGVFVFSVMWSELLMTSAIRCPLWSSVYECHKVECVFTSPVRTECGMFVMCCMQCCMSVSAVL